MRVAAGPDGPPEALTGAVNLDLHPGDPGARGRATIRRMASCDLVLRGGRVIDPESLLDGIRDVGIDGQHVAAVAEEPLYGACIGGEAFDRWR